MPSFHRYILTRHYYVRETPADKTGNKLSFNKKDDDDSDDDGFDEVAEITEVASLSEFDLEEQKIDQIE